MALLLLLSGASAHIAGVARARTPLMQYEVQAETVKVFGETKPNAFMTTQPLFTVQDWNRAKPIMEDFLNVLRTDYNCMYGGWTVSDNKLFARVAHVDGDAVIGHLMSVGECFDRLTAAGVATLDEISVHGPAAECAKAKIAIDAMGTGAPAAPPPPPPPPPPAQPPQGGLFGALTGLIGGGDSPPSPPPSSGKGPNAATAELLRELTEYYETEPSGISFITKETGGPSMGQRLCSVQQTYTVADWAKAKPLMDACVEQVEKESGCIYFGWTKCGDKLFCRGAHASAKAILKHIDNVKETVDALNTAGVATLERTQIHGPMAQTQLVKDSFKEYGYGGPKPKSKFLNLDDDPRFNGNEQRTEAEQAAAEAAKDAVKAAAFAAADKVAFFNVDGGFQRYEAVRLGGFEN